MGLAERVRDPSGFRAPGLPVQVLLVPPLLVPPLLVPPLLVPPLLVPPLLRLQALVPGMHRHSYLVTSEVSFPPVVVVTKKLWILLVPATAISSRCISANLRRPKILRFLNRIFHHPTVPRVLDNLVVNHIISY